MNKIKRGVSLLLCSLLFGSAVTLGNVADVQAGKQIKTETKQTINNTKTKKKVSDDQTSGKTGRNEENKAGEGAQTDIAESKVTFFVLPVYTQGTTAISIDRDIGIGQIMDVGFTDRNFAVAVYDSLFEAGWMGTPGQSVKEVLGSFTGMIKADGYARKVTYIASAPKSNASYLAIDKAIEQVKSQDCGQVPIHLRDCHYKGAKKLGHGVDYKYAHDYPYHIVKQQYLPDKIKNVKYYMPTSNGYEEKIGKYMQFCEKINS